MTAEGIFRELLAMHYLPIYKMFGTRLLSLSAEIMTAKHASVIM